MWGPALLLLVLLLLVSRGCASGLVVGVAGMTTIGKIHREIAPRASTGRRCVGVLLVLLLLLLLLLCDLLIAQLVVVCGLFKLDLLEIDRMQFALESLGVEQRVVPRRFGINNVQIGVVDLLWWFIRVDVAGLGNHQGLGLGLDHALERRWVGEMTTIDSQRGVVI